MMDQDGIRSRHLSTRQEYWIPSSSFLSTFHFRLKVQTLNSDGGSKHFAGTSDNWAIDEITIRRGCCDTSCNYDYPVVSGNRTVRRYDC